MSAKPDELIERARKGDGDASRELVALSYQKVYAFLRRLCSSNEDAEDLTQKTFAKAWSSLDSYRGRSTFNTWIHGIAYHAYVDWRRKRNPLDARTDDWWESCPATGPSPLEDAAERELAGRLCALVEKLDEECRETVHLHYYQGLSLLFLRTLVVSV